MIRVFLRLEGAFPTDAFAAPPELPSPGCADCRPRFSLHALLSLSRSGPWIFSLFVSPAVSPLSARRPNDSPTSGYSGSHTRPRLPWPVGGQAGVHESSSVAAHMHATASDRRTTSRRSRSRSNRSYRRRSSSRELSSKRACDHAVRGRRVDRLNLTHPSAGRNSCWHQRFLPALPSAVSARCVVTDRR